MKDIEGENVVTVVSYLKGALLFLKNCGDLPTDTHGLLNDIMCSASNDDFVGYMKSIYYEQKRSRKRFDFVTYLKIAESEYRTLHWAGKWTASVHVPSAAGFCGDEDGSSENQGRGYYGGRGGGRGGHGHGRG